MDNNDLFNYTLKVKEFRMHDDGKYYLTVFDGTVEKTFPIDEYSVDKEAERSLNKAKEFVSESNIIGIDYDRNKDEISVSLFRDPSPSHPYREHPKTVKIKVVELYDIIARKLASNFT